MDKISVVIPTYNRSADIGRAVDSVLAQTYSNLEVIIVDDGSTDDTAEQIKAYGDRVRYCWQNNSGVAAARNKGIHLATGDWVAFLDSDDAWHPNKLSSQMMCLEQYPSEVCFTQVSIVDEVHLEIKWQKNLPDPIRMELYDEPIELLLAEDYCLYVQSMVIRRSLLHRMGNFTACYRVAEDTDFFYRLVFETPFAIINEPLVRLNRNQNRKGLSQVALDNRITYCNAHLAIVFSAYTRCFDKSHFVRCRLKRIIGHYLCVRALMHCTKRQSRAARRAASNAFYFNKTWSVICRVFLIILSPRLVSVCSRIRNSRIQLKQKKNVERLEATL